MTESIQTLLEQAFSTLESEQPGAYARMCDQLDGQRVRLAIPPERFDAVFTQGMAVTQPADRAPTGVITTTRRTIDDSLSGRQSLSSALMEDALQVLAPLDLLVVLHDGWLSFVHGAVRCPSFPAILAAFRALLSERSAQEKVDARE